LLFSEKPPIEPRSILDMPDKPSIEQALRDGVLVFDGAMGTEIYRHHVFTNRCFDELTLADPKLIGRIHQDYCDAGADVLTTDTFGANRVKLGQYGLSEQLEEICTAGARTAREVADARSGSSRKTTSITACGTSGTR